MVTKVVFICTANTCRSPMAEYMFGAYLASRGVTDIEVASAGLYGDGVSRMAHNTREVLERRGIVDIKHVSKPYVRDDGPSVLFICMTRAHAENMPQTKNIVTMHEITGADIDDPWGGSLADYQRIETALQNALPLMFDYVTAKHKKTKKKNGKQKS